MDVEINKDDDLRVKKKKKNKHNKRNADKILGKEATGTNVDDMDNVCQVKNVDTQNEKHHLNADASWDESVKEKRRRTGKTKLEKKSDGKETNPIGEEEAPSRNNDGEDQKELHNEFELVGTNDKKKKRKKDESSKEDVGMRSAWEECHRGEELGKYPKEMGSNEMEEIFDGAIGREGDVVKEKKKGKRKKKDKKGTKEVSDDAVRMVGEVVKEKKSVEENKDVEGTKEVPDDAAGMVGDAKKEKNDKENKDAEAHPDDMVVDATKKKKDKKKKGKKGSDVRYLETNHEDNVEGHSEIELGSSKESKKTKKYNNAIKDLEKPNDLEKVRLDDNEVIPQEGKLSSFSKKRSRDEEEGQQHDKKNKKRKKAALIKDLREERVDVGEMETNNSETKKSPKKVKFSNKVEVFPLSDVTATKEKDQDVELVHGKRFSKEEDKILMDAVRNYIEENGLGEDGMKMVLHCKKHPSVKNCWHKINAAIPWRPRVAIYNRAHSLFERDGNFKWTPEDKEVIRKYVEEHGTDFRPLADELGKYRIHLKDTWRRIKLPNRKRGRWSQDEYQTLFDLVNKDLQMKVFEEKKSKHGMLRDNIAWEGISNMMSTRTNMQCCDKWYDQLVSPLVKEGEWEPADDYRLMIALLAIDVSCEEDVDWDNVLDHRPGDICRKRWKQMWKHLGELGNKPYPDQIELLSRRYCPNLLEAREIFDSKVPVDVPDARVDSDDEVPDL